MKKITKVVITTFSIILIIPVLAISYWGYRHVVPPKKFSYAYVNSPVNTDDPRECVGVAQYVFVAYLEETYDYYLTRYTRNFPEIIQDFAEPFTECVIKNVKNIEGDLEEGKEFSYYKTGGMHAALSFISIEDGDFIPETGNYFIFMAKGQPDGTLTGGGKGFTIQLEDWVTDDNVEQSELYKLYVDAFENQIDLAQDFPDYLAAEDVNFDPEYNTDLEVEFQLQGVENSIKVIDAQIADINDKLAAPDLPKEERKELEDTLALMEDYAAKDEKNLKERKKEYTERKKKRGNAYGKRPTGGKNTKPQDKNTNSNK